MAKLTRFGISIDSDLLKKFDSLISNENYSNRSEAIRDLIRDRLVEEEWAGNEIVAGAILMVYNHHTRGLSGKLTDIQHDHGDTVISTHHIHIDHHNCMEILAVKGKAKEIVALHNKLKSVKGVKHCELSKATVGKKV